MFNNGYYEIGKKRYYESSTVSQSVNQNHLFSKLADRSSVNFHTNFWFLKDKKVMHPGKNPKKKT